MVNIRDLDVSVASPNNQHKLRLSYESEIRFGPRYYQAYLDERVMRNRFFGHEYLWSQDSRLLVLQEWLSIDEISGPSTSLFICNTEELVYISKNHVLSGFIKPLHFEKTLLVFERRWYKNYWRTGKYELDILEIKNWDKLELG
ncbi:MAG: hypothetical protein GY755_03510 [Chloroflexi bacterium]|nr:hypothetical protein [Chloroflexota bacterium]